MYIHIRNLYAYIDTHLSYLQTKSFFNIDVVWALVFVSFHRNYYFRYCWRRTNNYANSIIDLSIDCEHSNYIKSFSRIIGKVKINCSIRMFQSLRRVKQITTHSVATILVGHGLIFHIIVYATGL
uniref:Uncharacterized protein n=1 Tax=Glossina brevipalpis TaxID=37001 RepID=A0A1A9WLU3_9MUSC